MKLDHGQLHLLKLAKRDADEAGWTKVSAPVWPLAAKLPDALVLKAPDEDGGGTVYVTQEGKTVLAWA